MARTLDTPISGPRGRSNKRLLALRGDAHLVARVGAGDDVAFEVLYDRYAALLLSFCRHMLGRPEEAEDAVQQVFASAHGALQRDGRDMDLKPWLYAIARNRCLSMLRARREQPDIRADTATEGLQEQVQERADLRQLVADLADLPERQRAALLLTELDDLSHAEVAAVLECKASQVKGLVFRARSALIERRDAREASCADIRAELASARRGALRRGRLRHHLAECPGCTAYLEDVRRQRRMMALILPVIPATGLKRSVLAAAGIGTGAGGAGGLTVAGGSIVGGTVAKVAAAAVLAGGAGVAGHEVLERPSGPAPAPKADQRPAAGATPAAGTGRPASTGSPSARNVAPPVGRRAKRAPSSGRPKQRAGSRGKGRGVGPATRRATPPGLTRRPARGLSKVAPARPVVPKAKANVPSTGRPRATPPAKGTPSPAPRAGPKTDKPAKP